MKNSARQFHCARCHKQVVICSVCDRGNIYCGPSCSRISRAMHQRLANYAYQKTLKGRQKHAQRQRSYRQRQSANQQKVTYQGSPDCTVGDLLRAVPEKSRSWPVELFSCHCCGKVVGAFLRSHFLRYHQDTRSRYSSFWSRGP